MYRTWTFVFLDDFLRFHWCSKCCCTENRIRRCQACIAEDFQCSPILNLAIGFRPPRLSQLGLFCFLANTTYACMRNSARLLTKKGSASSSRWLARARSDPFRASAAISAPRGSNDKKLSSDSEMEGIGMYVARSAHKLIELERKYHFLKPGKVILDLGAAPGGWTQVCLDYLNGQGRVIGVDLLDLSANVASRPGLAFIKGDLRDSEVLARLDALLQNTVGKEGPEPKVDVVLSDMLGNTSGNDVRDSQQSLELCELVVDLSQRYLIKEPEGTVIFKIFQSQDAADWRKNVLEKLYKNVSSFKPVSSRKASREVYYVCRKPRS